MAVIVTVARTGPNTLHFSVTGEVLPDVLEGFLDASLRYEVDTDQVLFVNFDDDHFTINHSDDIAPEWYVRAIDAVKDCYGDEHEVLSRLADWP